MAARVIDVFLNQSMAAFLDKDRAMPFRGNLYQNTDRYLVDEGLMVAANLHPADCTCTDTCNVQPTALLLVKEQTLLLIHLMRIYIEVKGRGPAKSLNDLNHLPPTRAPSPAQPTSSSSPAPASSAASPPPVLVPTRPSDTLRSRRRQREDDLLAYLERSDAASQRRHEETLAEMRALREDQRELIQLFYFLFF